MTTSDLIAQLSAAVRRGVTKEAAVVYRGISHPKLSHQFCSSKVGTKVTLRGFLSTSKSEAKARPDPGGTMLRIYIPKHACALECRQVSGRHDPEQEVILPHNSTFTIHAATKHPDGSRTVDLIMHR
jgi:hypothetical protein